MALTGAGISAESGIPTFRGADGLWRNHRAEELATPEAFARDPRTVWEWYDWRRGLVAGAEPNPAHRALARFERDATEFTLVTQNVDGLHRRAGSRALLELHGNLWRVRCDPCGTREWNETVPLEPLPPLCPCGKIQRPDVVWFGEPLDPEVLGAAATAASSCDLLLVIGTSAVVYPAAGLVPMALAAGAEVIEINPDATEYSSSVTIAVRERAGSALPAVLGEPGGGGAVGDDPAGEDG